MTRKQPDRFLVLVITSEVRWTETAPEDHIHPATVCEMVPMVQHSAHHHLSTQNRFRRFAARHATKGS